MFVSLWYINKKTNVIKGICIFRSRFGSRAQGAQICASMDDRLPSQMLGIHERVLAIEMRCSALAAQQQVIVQQQALRRI